MENPNRVATQRASTRFSKAEVRADRRSGDIRKYEGPHWCLPRAEHAGSPAEFYCV